jgi:hypothetical protein
MIAFAHNYQRLQQQEVPPQEVLLPEKIVDEAMVDPRLNTNALVRELFADLSRFD